MSKAKFIQENGETILPITHEEVVLDNNGKNLPSKYQQKQDENLLTESKTIVGAINELSTKGNEGTITSVPYTEGSDLDIEQVGGGSVGEVTSDDVKIAYNGKNLTEELNVCSQWIQSNQDWLQEINDVAYANQGKIGETELATNDKTLTGAINELFQNVDNGKNLIATSIGEPLSAEDTFQAMSNDINGLLSTFKTNMMNNGVTVDSSDKFKQLIDKLATLSDNEGKGVQFASGTLTLSSATSPLEVSNLTFKPDIVLIHYLSGYLDLLVYNKHISDSYYYQYDYSSSGTTFYSRGTGTTSITDTGFNFTNIIFPSNVAISYYAIGVGEEDTTLRDSLASILQEEGVEVTEEDDMASLITKVDSEFDDNRSRLYELMSESGYDVNSSMSLDSLLDLLDLSGISASDIKQIACGINHTFILKTNGSLWSCGQNTNGQLGLGDNTNTSSFTQVTTNINNDVEQVACGQSYTIILKNDGTMWSCGANGTGQLGLGDIDNRNTFTQVTTNINNDVKQIVCGMSHTFVLKNDGSIWACGYNYNGQLGLNSTTNRYTFTQVTTNINNDVKQISCGTYHTVILKNDGSLWSCGYNESGQLGLNDFVNRITFTQVTTSINNDVKQISCGYSHTFILKTDDSIWSCGVNQYGQLGLNSTTDQSTFIQVTKNINNDVKQIVCGSYHTFILKNDGTVWSCGYNGTGQLGLNSTTDQSTFTQVTTSINNDVKQISCGDQHTFILKTDGSIWSCGYNYYGQLGYSSNNKIIFNTIPRGF